jgi:hypothetical protein
MRGIRTADRRSDQYGEGDGDERQKPPPARVCRPKHGGGPYHSFVAGDPL